MSYIEGVWEQAAMENIWTYKRESGGKVEKDSEEVNYFCFLNECY
jgi:hypothetical protein